MQKLIITLAATVAVAALLAPLVVAIPADAQASQACAARPHGGTEGVFAIRAGGTTCTVARSVVYGKGSGYSLCHAADPIHNAYRCVWHGWQCQVGKATTRYNYAIPVRCTKGRATVTWYEGY